MTQVKKQFKQVYVKAVYQKITLIITKGEKNILTKSTNKRTKLSDKMLSLEENSYNRTLIIEKK